MTPPFVDDAGRPAADVLAELRRRRAQDLSLDRVTAYHFEPHRPELRRLALAAAELAWGVSSLNPVAFPSVADVENDLVATTAAWHGGGPSTVGTVTSGGTESCLLAVLGARERWRSLHGSASRQPLLVLPVTAHPAFRKAAHLFGLQVADVPVDPQTFAPDPAEVERLVARDGGRRAALVVVSAPEYAHGTIDPVPAVAAIAARHGVPCHLDLCIGGFVVPFVREAEGLPPIGLSTPGVTSLSADLHKYGFAPKGVSVLLHADDALRRHHWFADASWPGYPLVNPTLLSSRPAAPAAAAWAVLAHLGRDGVRALALRSREAALALAAGVEAIDGLRVVTPPQATLVAITDTGDPAGPDVYTVVDELTARGWDVQAQPARHGSPPTAHVTMTPGVADQLDDLLAALADATVAAAARGRAAPDPRLGAAASALATQGTRPADLDDATIGSLLAAAGIGAPTATGDGGAGLPERMAELNALLDRLPPPLVERLLVALLGGILTPRR